MHPRWGRGRHRKRVRRRPRRARVLRVLGVVLLVAGAGAAVGAVWPAARPAVPIAGPSPAPPSTPTAAPAAPVDPAAAALQACATAVARGRAAVDAAQPSYSHWAAHVRAQLDLDAGLATLDQARERWAATRATADADLAGFTTVYAAFPPVRDGCAVPAAVSPAAVTVPSAAPAPDVRDRRPGAPTDPVLAGCRTEFAAVDAAVTAAKAVVDDWAAHVAMMKDKAHTDPQQYGRRWHEMVAAASVHLDGFARATLAMDEHTGCPAPS